MLLTANNNLNQDICLLWKFCETTKKVCSSNKRVFLGISEFSRGVKNDGYIGDFQKITKLILVSFVIPGIN